MIEYWHNPRCSKSRAGLALLEGNGAELQLRKYLENAPSVDELRAVQAMLGVPAIDMMRTGEKRFKELGLAKDTPEDQLLQAMAENPVLI
jgi:arsenate reductase